MLDSLSCSFTSIYPILLINNYVLTVRGVQPIEMSSVSPGGEQRVALMEAYQVIIHNVCRGP